MNVFFTQLSEELNMHLEDVSKIGRGNLTGLMVPVADNMMATIYLEDHLAYDDDYDTFKAKILAVIDRIDSRCAPKVDIDLINEWDRAKENLYFRPVYLNGKKRYSLKNHPIMEMEGTNFGFVPILHLILDEVMHEEGTVAVTFDLLETWGKTPEEVFAETRKKTPVAYFGSMGKALSKKLGPLSDFEAIVKDYEGREFPPMYVLTNKSNFFGSGVLAYDGVLKEVSDKIFSKELIILPSSVHEVIVIPNIKGVNLDELTDMVREVNRTQVQPWDVLSDTAYIYDADADTFTGLPSKKKAG